MPIRLKVSPDEMETLEMQLEQVLDGVVNAPAEGDAVHEDGARRQAEKDRVCRGEKKLGYRKKTMVQRCPKHTCRICSGTFW